MRCIKADRRIFALVLEELNGLSFRAEHFPLLTIALESVDDGDAIIAEGSVARDLLCRLGNLDSSFAPSHVNDFCLFQGVLEAKPGEDVTHHVARTVDGGGFGMYRTHRHSQVPLGTGVQIARNNIL